MFTGRFVVSRNCFHIDQIILRPHVLHIQSRKMFQFTGNPHGSSLIKYICKQVEETWSNSGHLIILQGRVIWSSKRIESCIMFLLKILLGILSLWKMYLGSYELQLLNLEIPKGRHTDPCTTT